MSEDNPDTPSLSTGLSNLTLHRNRTVSSEEAPHNKVLHSTHTQLLLANEIKEQFSLLPESHPSHDPIVGTSFRVITLSLNKIHFKGIDSRVSPLNKMVTNSTRSVTIPDISKRKRASPDSSGSSIEIQSILSSLLPY